MKYQQIKLPTETVEDIAKFAKTFGPAWVELALNTNKARIYVEQELDLVKRDVKSRMCYSEGNLTYSRKDKGPITQDDEDALLAISLGQVTCVSSKTEDSITIRFVCDSGD